MKKNRKLRVELRAADRAALEHLLRAGVQPVRVIKRAQALRLMAEGQSPPQTGRAVGLNAETVRRIGWRYAQEGLERALYERPRPGRRPSFTAGQFQRVVAMVCGPPPEGRARWTVRLVAEEVPQRGLGPPLGREAIRLWLERHDLKPWREKNVVCTAGG